MATFPTALDTFATLTDNSSTASAVDITALQTAVAAVEAKVGIDNSAATTSLDYLLRKGFHHGAYASALQSITSATWTKVNLDTDNFRQGFVALAANVLTVPQTGLYSVGGAVAMASACTRLIAGISINATNPPNVNGDDISNATLNAVQVGPFDLSLTAGQTLGLWVFQNSGGAVNTTPGSLKSFIYARLVALTA